MAFFYIALGVLLLAFTVLMSVIILRGRGRVRGRSHFSPYEKPVALATVWNDWPAAPGCDDAERARRSAVFANVTPAHRDAVREDLLAFERRALAEDEPLLAIRRELMASVDRRMLNREILALPEHIRQRLRAESNDVIADDDSALAYLAANELRLEVLREYAARRYGDRAPNDWFEIYEHASLLKQRTARNYITRSMNGELDDEGNARQQAVSLVDSQLRTHLLKVAPGTRFDALPGRERP